MDRGLGHGKKIRYHLNSYGRLKLMTCSNTHREQIFYRKKMTDCHIERGFLLRVDLSLDVWPSLKSFLHNICLLFDLL